MKIFLATTAAIGISAISLTFLASRAAEMPYCYQWERTYCMEDRVEYMHIGEGVTKLEITKPTVFIFHAQSDGWYQLTSWSGEVDRWLNPETFIGTLKPGKPIKIGLDKGVKFSLTATPPYTMSPGKRDVFHPRKVAIQIRRVGSLTDNY